MSEPVSGSASNDWEAVMAEALAASGGPLTDDEREWAALQFGLSFDPTETGHASSQATPGAPARDGR